MIGPKLSPFEAYLASGLLIYQKLFNNDYVLTSAEEKAKAQTPQKPPNSGFRIEPSNSRRLEFRQRVEPLTSRWSTASAAAKEINDIIEESRND